MMDRKKDGFVLVVVLWILATLLIITFGMVERVMLDHRAAMYALNQTEAMIMARGACARATVDIRNKAFEDAIKMAEIRNNPNANPNWQPTEHLGQAWAQPQQLHEDETLFEHLPDMENDYVGYSIIDAERFININGANEKMLDAVPNLDRGTLRKINVRRTKEIHKGEGVSHFQAIEELRYMDGIDEEDWFGNDKDPGLRDLFTIYGTSGTAINVNTASKDVLLSIPDLSSDVINGIIEHRSGADGELGTPDDQPFFGHVDLRDALKLQDESYNIISQYCIYRSYHFIIKGVATLQGGKVRAECTSVVSVEGFFAREIAYKEEIFGT